MKNLSQKQIKEDFDYLKKNLINTHPNPFLFISKEDLENSLDTLAKQSEELYIQTFFFKLMEIFAQINDSHTKIKGFEKILSKEKYPLRFKYLGDRYYITATDIKYKKHIGSYITHLNNTPINKVISKMSKVLTHENDVVLSNAIEQWIYEPVLLEYLGIIHSDLILEIKTDRDIFNIKPKKISDEELYNPREESIKGSMTLEQKGLYWTKSIEDILTYYIQYNECEELTKEEVESMIGDIKKKNLKYVVVDLRNNPGGSSLLLDPLTEFLFKNQDIYKPFVFISNLTYSAAIINALNILDGKNAISIGRKTSGPPTKFGQTTTITLPNTKLDVVISTKTFEEKGYEYGEPLVPMIEIEQTIDQYLRGEDLEWMKFLEMNEFSN